MFYRLAAWPVKTSQKQSASLDKVGRLRLVHHQTAPLYNCQTPLPPLPPLPPTTDQSGSHFCTGLVRGRWWWWWEIFPH